MVCAVRRAKDSCSLQARPSSLVSRRLPAEMVCVGLRAGRKVVADVRVNLLAVVDRVARAGDAVCACRGAVGRQVAASPVSMRA
jgi:hypothetical protein